MGNTGKPHSGAHIVHVVESFGGGVISFVEQLCHHLPQYTHTVVHAIRPTEVDAALIQARFPAQVSFIHWPHAVRQIAPLADIKALRALLKILPTLLPDMVHLHSSKAGFIGRIACHLLRLPAVIYTPGGVALLRQDISATQRFMYGALEAFGSLFGGVVVACGPSEAKALAHYRVATTIIANGTEPGPEPTPRPPAPAFIKVVALGRATAQKNPAQFGRIAKALVAKGGWQFVWVGSGELEHTLLAASVTCTGWLPATQARAHLAEADIYMSTSVWEGLSLAVLEAMGAGLPLVLSACPGNTDVVQPGQNGYLFTTDAQAIAALQTLAADAGLRATMGMASRKLLVQEHDVRQVAQGYHQLYQKLIRKGGTNKMAEQSN